MDLVPTWILRQGSYRAKPPQASIPSPLAGLLSLAVAGRRWRPEQGLLSLGRGELKYWLLTREELGIWKGSGHTGLRVWARGSRREPAGVPARSPMARAEHSRASFQGTAFLRALGRTAVSRVSPGLWASLPRFLPIPQDSGSTYGVQGLEFLPQVSHSALLAWVHWLPGTLFVWPILCRHLQILALPYHGCQ